MTRVTRTVSLAMAAALILAILVAPGTITEAQHAGKVKVTGKVTDKLIQRFDASGLSGARSVEYRRLTMEPGARMEGLMVMDDHVEFCFVEKGAVTMTTVGGAKRTYKAGDVFVKPKGLKQTVIAADLHEGYVELTWRINLKGH